MRVVGVCDCDQQKEVLMKLRGTEGVEKECVEYVNINPSSSW